MATVETKWSIIPEDYKYTAVDESGEKYAYSHKPHIYEGCWAIAPISGYKTMCVGFVLNCGDWHESLRERP